MGRAEDRETSSRKAAARALISGFGLVTDFRRVTRWLALKAPVRREVWVWELVRECDRPGSVDEVAEGDDR